MTERITATERLWALLDERGVEWEGREDIHTDFTFWCGVHACETGPKPSLAVYHLTPEQAIAATLGSSNCSNSERTSERTGTCVNMDGEADAEWFTCSECNTELRVHEPFDSFSIRYCPSCGRKVVDE